MIARGSIIFGAAALLVATVAADRPFLLLNRADSNESAAVGTNLYNCHDNCGEAILEEEVDGYCNSTIFSTDYAACLQCSGPDNEDIWQYYGPYLTEGAEACGSSTVPLDGTQADVATALAAQTDTTAAATAAATATATGSSATNTASTTASAGSTAASTAAASTASSTAESSAQKDSVHFNGLMVGVVAAIIAATGIIA